MRFVRLLPRQRGPLLGGVAVIAAGVGLAAMVFALVDAYVWKPLPYADPDRLVSIDFAARLPTPGAPRVTQADLPSLVSWRDRRDLFEDLAAFEDRDWLRVELSGRILPVRTVAASRDLFQVLGLAPRWTDPDPASAWVSRRLATTLSGGELQSGQSARIVPDGRLYVQGVLPPDFLLPEPDRTLPPDVLVELPDGPVMTKNGASTSWPRFVARLRAGVAPDVAAAALSATMPSGEAVQVTPLTTAMTARVRALATGALLASGLIVVVCWMNVFSIALTRGLYRAPEIATRTALGATPIRIVRLLAAEGAQMALFGAVFALVVARLTLATVVGVLPPQFATLGVPAVTSRVALAIVLTAAIAGVSWTLASILAWQFGGERQTRLAAGRDGRVIRLLRFGIVTGQLAVSSVFLAGAILLGRSYLNLMGIDVGMNRWSETLTVAHDPGLPDALWRETVDRTIAAFRRMPGVRAAGASRFGFLDGRGAQRLVHLDARMADYLGANDVDEIMRARGIASVDSTIVTDGYFDAMGLAIVAGRHPRAEESDAVVANETLARQFFGDQSPIGATLSLAGGKSVTIVGVVRDVRAKGITVPPRPALYEVDDSNWGRGTVTYVVSFGDAAQARTGWRNVVQQVDRMAVVLDSGSVGDRLDRSIRDRTFATLVVSLFAFATIVVTALGLAGIVAYTVVRRTHDIAVRLAIGAGRRRVIALVVRDALAAGTCGVVGGLIASIWLSRGLDSLLFGVRPADLAMLLLSGVSLLGIVLGAAIVPALRAARIEPATALRMD
ncbi:MAG TPA: FtsX-like permease family protein [Vicinamibacterales bacterium]|jgi:predicted permease|nr:FtsX-like permease family protein [Vicinamibacterales bacterium]